MQLLVLLMSNGEGRCHRWCLDAEHPTPKGLALPRAISAQGAGAVRRHLGLDAEELEHGRLRIPARMETDHGEQAPKLCNTVE